METLVTFAGAISMALLAGCPQCVMDEWKLRTRVRDRRASFQV